MEEEREALEERHRHLECELRIYVDGGRIGMDLDSK